jgi:AraC-like DNA-binding protein
LATWAGESLKADSSGGHVPHTIRAATLRGFEGLARSVGLPPLRLLDAAGVPRAALTNPDIRISAASVRDLMGLCGAAIEDFALRMYEVRSPSDMGPVALIARQQPTLRATLEALNRNLALHSDVTRVWIDDDASYGAAVIRLVQTWPTPGPERQTTELALGQLMRTLRGRLGPDWQPLEVWLTHGPPLAMDTHHRILGTNLCFHQPFNGVACTRLDLDRPDPAADPEMTRQIQRYVDGLPNPAPADLPDQVLGLAHALLPLGQCTTEIVARQIGVVPRTLQRQLAASGTRFIDIVQRARMTLCQRYLEHDDRRLAEVAQLLGFSALSAFSRWHRIHYGGSPSDRRRAALPESLR